MIAEDKKVDVRCDDVTNVTNVTLCREGKIVPISSQKGGQSCCYTFYLRKYNVRGKNTLELFA
jgi:hypothetical protein